MWLDGLYMGAAFLAQYESVFGEEDAFADVVKQFVLMEEHARDEKTGLLFHGWDETQAEVGGPQTGRSPTLWERAMGWYAMGLVDTLDFVAPTRAAARSSRYSTASQRRSRTCRPAERRLLSGA